MTKRSNLVLGVALAAATGCSDSIAPEAPDAATGGGGSGSGSSTDAATGGSGRVTTTRGSDGTYTTVVDSTAMGAWIHGDFETGSEVDASAAWDLRFQRFHISTNGGVTGGGGVQVAALANTTFAEVAAAPSGGWVSDTADGDDANTDPDYAFEQGEGWYSYDASTHKLTPRPIVWVLKTAGGATLKLEILDYYDDAGTSGWLTLHWGAL